MTYCLPSKSVASVCVYVCLHILSDASAVIGFYPSLLCVSHFCSHKAKGQQAWDAALHSIASCSLLHMNFPFPSTYYYLNVCHLFLGNYCWACLGKKGSILNAAALWINALDLQTSLLHCYLFPSNCWDPFRCYIFRPWVLEFGFYTAYIITFKTMKLLWIWYVKTTGKKICLSVVYHSIF